MIYTSYPLQEKYLSLYDITTTGVFDFGQAIFKLSPIDFDR